MKNHEQLPAIDENVLNGVAGGMSDSTLSAIEGRVGVAKEAVKLPFSLAGLAANFAGDVYGQMSDFWHGIGDKLSGGSSKS